jgi:hypothetical protein
MATSEQTMQYTRAIHAASAALVVSLLPAAGCGQMTGLSDDYLFDLADGAAADAASDARADAPDAAGDARDAAPRCSATEISNAQQAMKSNGSAACKSCLATSCCTDVVTCAASNECGRVLACKLACSQSQGADRTSCSRDCTNSGGGAPALYTSGVGACSATCQTACGF